MSFFRGGFGDDGWSAINKLVGPGLSDTPPAEGTVEHAVLIADERSTRFISRETRRGRFEDRDDAGQALAGPVTASSAEVVPATDVTPDREVWGFTSPLLDTDAFAAGGNTGSPVDEFSSDGQHPAGVVMEDWKPEGGQQ